MAIQSLLVFFLCDKCKVAKMEFSARSGTCNVCYKNVGVRQHAFECDICKTWVRLDCTVIKRNV